MGNVRGSQLSPRRTRQRTRSGSQLSEGLTVKTDTVTQYLFCHALAGATKQGAGLHLQAQKMYVLRTYIFTLASIENVYPRGHNFTLDKGTPLNPFRENRSRGAHSRERPKRPSSSAELTRSTCSRSSFRPSDPPSTRGAGAPQRRSNSDPRKCSRASSEQRETPCKGSNKTRHPFTLRAPPNITHRPQQREHLPPTFLSVTAHPERGELLKNVLNLIH